MSKLCNLKNLVTKITVIVPQHLQTLQEDLRKNFNFIKQNTINKLNMVTREEFAVQSKVLARARQKIKELESLINKSSQNK